MVFCSLPLPWFLFTLVFQKPVPVSAEGMVCSIVLLFMMLVMVFLSILIFNWKMTKFMGFSMFVFYFFFLGSFAAYHCPGSYSLWYFRNQCPSLPWAWFAPLHCAFIHDVDHGVFIHSYFRLENDQICGIFYHTGQNYV